jgi:CheY-like chemotaxis protein
MLAPPSSSSLRVLIVDDIKFNQKALQMQLKGVLGSSVAAVTVFDFADDGAQAFEMVQQAAAEGRPYHVVWMDLLVRPH